MKKLKSAGLILSPFFILATISLTWIALLKPKILEFAMSQAPRINQMQDVIEVQFKNLDLSLLKLQVSAQNINLVIKKNPLTSRPLTIESLKLQLNPFKLLVGQIQISQLIMDQLNWDLGTLVLPETQSKNDLPLDLIFNTLEQIPINQIILNQANIKFYDEKTDFHIQFKNEYLSLTNHNRSLQFTTKELKIRLEKTNQSSLLCELNTQLSWKFKKSQQSSIDIHQLDLSSLNSHLKINGKIEKFSSFYKWPEIQTNITSEIHFEDIKNIGLTLFPQKNRLPMVTGYVKIKGPLQAHSVDSLQGTLDIETTQVNFDHFKLGQAQVKINIEKSQLHIQQIELQHAAGLALIKQVSLEQKPPFQFKTQVEISNLNLQKLFVSLNLNDIPVGLNGKATLRCQGVLRPALETQCEVESYLKDIWVKSSLKDKFYIVKIKSTDLSGKFQLTPEQIAYETAIRMGQSSGTSDGVVDFKEGFRINFNTNALHFTDIESLAGLDFKGDLKIKGQTWGDSHHGLIEAQSEFTKGEINQFVVGNLKSPLKYENTVLSFDQIDGKLGQSKYNGQIDFDFGKSVLNGSLNLSELRGEDVITALQRPLQIPFLITGQGYATVNFNGPFDFWKLNFNLKSFLKKGQILDEGFETLKFDAASNGKNINFDQVFLKKTKSKITVTGGLNTESKDPIFQNVQVLAKPLWLDDISHLTQITNHLTGQMWADGKVSGTITQPNLSFSLNAQQVNYDGVDYPSSQADLILNRQSMNLKTQMIGRQLQIDTLWPWSSNSAYTFKLQVRDLNPLLFLPLISLPQPSQEYYSKLNAEVDLKGPNRHLTHSTGFFRIDDFMLQRGAQYLKINKPASILFNNGLNQIDPIELKGEGNSISILSTKKKSEQIELSVIANLQLKLFQFLVPFSQNLSGKITTDTQVILRENSFELLGLGQISDMLILLSGFPQPIDHIETPLEFSKTKILLNDIKAQLGPNHIAGAGQIDIRGTKNILVNMQAQAEHVEIVFPEKITTVGRAQAEFFGSWLPYNLKINYDVQKGLIEKDFGVDDNSGKSFLKLSPFLPPQQIEKQVPSLLLDVNIHMPQPVIVKNRLIEGETTGDLKITGTPEHPEIVGKVDIKQGGKLFFKDKPFDIQTATIEFLPNSEITPEIYITSNARVADYDINLLVQGIPGKNLSIKPTSQPPLSESDIFSLLALGLTSSQLDQNLSSKTQQQQTGLEVLAAIGNQSQINKKFQEKFGLTVQLAPSIDSTKNIAVPKMVVSKKIQKNINASYSRPLTGDTQDQEWKLQYLFNPNKSIILNYQNKESTHQEQIRNSNTNDTGVIGLDFEYKKEFK